MRLNKKIISLVVALSMLFAIAVGSGITASAAKITTTPTGYTDASDVEYKTYSGTIANWGARGEVCLFLSSKAESYYTGKYTYESLSAYSGGTSQSNAYTSALYSALQDMMKSNHDHETSYGETRYLYKYTDCVSNDISTISSFYSGTLVSGTWDSGKTWNREHTWPNSKGLDGNDENDIMMLRPTSVQENSARGNTAYGESSAYYDPGESLRGDCARIVLYVYTRWGNTGKMWGSSGVMENLTVLLKWMEEDPVDTWEMGRNDAVESITGVRNVFVDYPEFAWLLFGQEVPVCDTPSGNASPTNPDGSCRHASKTTKNAVSATCASAGYTGDVYCTRCNELITSGSEIPISTVHTWSAWSVTSDEKSYIHTCSVCEITETVCRHANTETRNQAAETCAQSGYTGDVYCLDCGTKVSTGNTVSATGSHTWSGWTVSADGKSETRVCGSCGAGEMRLLDGTAETIPPVSDPSNGFASLTPEIIAIIDSASTEEQKMLIYLSLGIWNYTFLSAESTAG